MTRAFLLIGVFLCSLLIAGIAAADDYKLLDSTTDRAVLVPGTQTSDGHYALAWTVLPKKNAEPVDWSILDTGEFEKRYLDEDYLEDAQYEPANLVVDLRAKKVIGKFAQGDDACYRPHKNHALLIVSWGPEQNGRRFALVEVTAKWEPALFDVLDVGPDGIRKVEPHPLFGKAVVSAIRRCYANAHIKSPDIAFDYEIAELPEIASNIGFLDATTVRLSFSTMDETKSGTPDVGGEVTFKLTRAGKGITVAVTKITAELGGGLDSDDKFTGDARNAKIERELNEVYTALMRKLDSAAKEQLREQQRGWLKDREAFVEKFEQTFDFLTEMENRRIVLDRSLREMTEKRVAEMRQRE
jgi:uncharacterized protein YecT (DUF1311 family)